MRPGPDASLGAVGHKSLLQPEGGHRAAAAGGQQRPDQEWGGAVPPHC